MFDDIYNKLKDNPYIVFLTFSIIVNIYLGRLLLRFNDRYIGVLKENVETFKSMNVFFSRIKLKSIKSSDVKGELKSNDESKKD